MKKIIIFALFIALISPVIGKAQPTMSISSSNASQGQIVCLNVTVNNFTDILNLQCSFHWDPAILQFNSLTGFNLTYLNQSAFGTNGAAAGNLTMAWYDQQGDGESLPNGTVMFQLCFNVVGSVGSSSSIWVDGIPTSIEVTDVNSGGENIGLNINGGSVTVLSGGTNDGIHLTASNVISVSGSNVCLSLSVADFTAINSMQFSMSWNPAILQYTGVSGLALNYLNMGSFNTSSVNQGSLSLSWQDLSGGITLPDGSIIFQVCFNVIGNPGEISPFIISGNPTPVFVTNTSSGSDIGLTNQNGQVQIVGPSDVLSMTGSDVIVNHLQSGCVDISVQHFSGISNMQYSINWDPAVAHFDSVSAINLPELTMGDFNLSNVSNGVITLQWNSSSPSGTTIPDNTVIFRLCFKGVGSPLSTTPIAFTDSPLDAQVFYANGDPLVFQSQPGSFSINQSGYPPLVLNVPDGGGSPGDTVCLDISVSDFNQIISMQYSINWNPALMQYVSVGGFNLVDLGVSNFGYNFTNQGKLSFSWFDQTNTGITLPDGTTIYEVCFKLIGNIGQTDTLVFSNDPTSIEVTTLPSNGEDIGISSGITQVQIQGSILISDNLVTAITCYNPGGGGIDISVSGGLPPLHYHWSNNASTQDISGLAPGTYTVTISDSSVPPITQTGFYTIESNMTPPTVVTPSVGSLNCQNAQIHLSGMGTSTGPTFTYNWTTINGSIVNGANTLSPLVDHAGTYQLNVTNNENGCTANSQVSLALDTIHPVALATATGILNCGQPTVNINGSGSSGGANISYNWTTTNGTIVSGNGTNTLVVSASGTYQLLVTNNVNLCTSSDTALVSNNPETPIATIAPPGTLTCTQTTVTLDASQSSSLPGQNHVWSTGNGVFSGGTNTLMPTVTAPGTYRLIVSNPFCSDTAEVTVVANTTSPQAKAGPDGSITCTNPLFTPTTTGTSQGASISYQWTTTNGTIVSGPNSLAPQFSAAGQYRILVSDSQNGCSAADTVQVTDQRIIPNADAGTGAALQCEATSIQLDGGNSSMGPNISYQWTAQSGTILSGGTTLDPEVTAGVYQLIVSNNSNGCKDTASVTITAGTPLPDADAGPDVNTCNGALTLGATLPGGFTGVWTSNSGITITDPASPTTEVDIASPGTVQFIWTLSGTGCPSFSSDTVTVVLQETLQAHNDQFSMTAGTTTLDMNVIANDQPAGASNVSIGLVSEPSSGTLSAPGTEGFVYTVAPGFSGVTTFTYALCGDACGAQVCDTATVTITVPISPTVDTTVNYPNAITPNGDGHNDELIFDELTDPTKFPDNEIIIFNRWGDVVYRAKPYLNDWKGQNQKGLDLPQATYYYILRLNIGDSRLIRGDVTVLK